MTQIGPIGGNNRNYTKAFGPRSHVALRRNLDGTVTGRTSAASSASVCIHIRNSRRRSRCVSTRDPRHSPNHAPRTYPHRIPFHLTSRLLPLGSSVLYAVGLAPYTRQNQTRTTVVAETPSIPKTNFTLTSIRHIYRLPVPLL